ncbi:MAG: hypothetical protein ABIP68_03915 [Ferruginibacter sp.]
MKIKFEKIAGSFLIAFGLISLFMTTTIILDLFGMRAKEGNYVLFVVWANFACAILYIISGICFIYNKKITTFFLAVASIILVITFAELFYHINQGIVYETRTVAAMAFRTLFTISMLMYSLKVFKSRKTIL